MAAYTANSNPRGAINPASSAQNNPVKNAVGLSARSVINKLPAAKGIANDQMVGSLNGPLTFCAAVKSASRNATVIKNVCATTIKPNNANVFSAERASLGNTPRCSINFHAIQ